jgi:hypothetical protein
MQGRAYCEVVISNAINALKDGQPVTRPRIERYTRLSKDQVKRYWKPFTSLVNEYNENLKVAATIHL